MRLHEIEETENLFEKYKDEIKFALDKYNQGIVIYRGSETYQEDILYIDPTTRTTDRKSANTYNYYTLWMSNNLQWAEYPKRNRSLICSTNYRNAKIYGVVKIVVPLIDCKIGICPKFDLWKSFNLVNEDLEDLNSWLLSRFKNKWPDQDNKNVTYPQLLQKLKEINSTDTNEFYNAFFEKKLKRYGNAENMFEMMLDPTINKFQLSTWKQFNIKQPDGRLNSNEVWLSAPCLLIELSIFEKLAEERKYATS